MRNKAKYFEILSFCTVTSMVTAYLTTNYLVKTAMDRTPPKGLNKVGSLISGTNGNNTFYQEVKRCGEELKASKVETIEIVSHDNLKLVGHWSDVEHPKRVILAMHGWRSSWYKDFGMVSQRWKENDCCVLFAEQRGQSASGGDYMGFGITERFDCLDWIHYINERTGGSLPIYMAGVSMGATTVLMASDLDLPDNVCGIIADCGFTSPEAIWKHIMKDNLHIAYGIKGFIADEMYQRKTNGELWSYSTTDALKNSKIPILFVHGTDDHFVPVEMTYENYKACSAPKKLLIVPGADHGMSYYLAKQEYENIVIKFWNEFDK